MPLEQVRQAHATESDAAGGPVMPAMHSTAPLRAAVITADHRGKPAAPTPAQAGHATAGEWQQHDSYIHT